MNLTRRDYFAGCALAGLLASRKTGEELQRAIEDAIDWADALLAALGEQEKPWECMGRQPAQDPQDCNYPFCGCSPEATRAINFLKESGWGPLDKLQKRLAVREKQLEILKSFVFEISEGYRKGGYSKDSQTEQVMSEVKALEKELEQ